MMDYSTLAWIDGAPPNKVGNDPSSPMDIFPGMVVVFEEDENFYLVGDINPNEGLCDCCGVNAYIVRWAWLPGFEYPEWAK